VKPVQAVGKLISLRELREADAPALHAVYGDPDVCRHMSFTPRTAGECAAIIAAARKDVDADPRQVYMLAVCGDGDELIGAARLGLGEWKSAQFGIALRPDQWGHGRGTEAVRLLFRLAFRDLDVHRVWGARSPRNYASGRLMTAAGMTEDGTIRSHVLRHGVWEDSATASILQDEFTE
jgi:[ribosomal protein S5]-alanine N-acetyltransferase